MKFVFPLLIIALAALPNTLLAQDTPEENDSSDTTTATEVPADIKEKVSYGFGLNQAKRLQTGGIELDPSAVAQGFKDAYADSKPKYTEEELQQAFTEYDKILAAKREADLKELSEKNQKEATDFLTKNKTATGVKTTKSGLQYKVVKPGTGANPKATDVVKVHYHGTFPDGKVFDSSVDRNMPATFPVNGVIDGWQEALQLMKVGGKWMLYIPPKLAYGENGSSGAIGPNQLLIFEVELLDIVKADTTDDSAPRDN